MNAVQTKSATADTMPNADVRWIRRTGSPPAISVACRGILLRRRVRQTSQKQNRAVAPVANRKDERMVGPKHDRLCSSNCRHAHDSLNDDRRGCRLGASLVHIGYGFVNDLRDPQCRRVWCAVPIDSRQIRAIAIEKICAMCGSLSDASVLASR